MILGLLSDYPRSCLPFLHAVTSSLVEALQGKSISHTVIPAIETISDLTVTY